MDRENKQEKQKRIKKEVKQEGERDFIYSVITKRHTEQNEVCGLVRFIEKPNSTYR